jgi:glycosyltransferase involved in cell wall biosynthesis
MINFRWHTIKYFADLGYSIKILAPNDYNFFAYQNVEYLIYGKLGRTSTMYDLLKYTFLLRGIVLKAQVQKNDVTYLFAYSPKMILISTLATMGTRCIFFPFFIGLGSLFLNKKYLFVQKIMGFLIRVNRSIPSVICLNSSDKLVLTSLIKKKDIKVLKGEGLPERRYQFIYPNKNDSIRFILISRPLKEKGVVTYLEAIKYFRDELKLCANFSIYGFDKSTIGTDLPKSFLNDCSKYEIVLHGFCENILKQIKSRDVLLLPSEREGMSRVCMEMTELGIPVIASDVPGIHDIVSDNETGLLISPITAENFAMGMAYFANLSRDEFDVYRVKIKNSTRRYATVQDQRDFYLSLLAMST